MTHSNYSIISVVTILVGDKIKQQHLLDERLQGAFRVGDPARGDILCGCEQGLELGAWSRLERPRAGAGQHSVKYHELRVMCHPSIPVQESDTEILLRGKNADREEDQ